MPQIDARQMLDKNGNVYFPFTHIRCVEGMPEDFADYDIGTIREDMGAVQTQTTELQNQVSSILTQVNNMVTDTGWINIPLSNGITEYDTTWTPKVRLMSIKGVYFLSLRGAVKGLTGNVTIGTLPSSIASRLTTIKQFVQSMSVTSGTPNFNRWRINTNGTIVLEYSTTSITSAQWVSIDTTIMI